MKHYCTQIAVFFMLVGLLHTVHAQQWNALWTKMGGMGTNTLNAGGSIKSICKDASGNIYAAGQFTNNNGHCYVAKYNGRRWSELGGTDALAANDVIQSICSDAKGNIYAAGNFQNNSNNNYYVAKYDVSTDSWSELGGSDMLAANSTISSICSDASGNIYAAGYFINSSNKYYVAKYDVNANSWSELGGSGSNPLAANNAILSICSDASGNIYAAGYFTNGTDNSNGNYYVAKYDGSSWSELGVSNPLNAGAPIWSICSDAAGNIYAAGQFTDDNSKQYVAKYNGSSWSELGGSNPLNANSIIYSICSDASGNIYAAGDFTNGTDNMNGNRYVAKYDGNGWSELGGTDALAANNTGTIWSVCSDAAGNIYTAGEFNDGTNNYVAKYNSNTWTELSGSGALAGNDDIQSICNDASGNIYAAGDFQNNSGNQYVAKYDVTTNSWTELGGSGTNPLNANGTILSICSDASGNIYAAGEFTDGSDNNTGNKYVAKYDVNTNSWSELGGSNPLGANNPIHSICTDASGNIYAAGEFTDGSDNSTGNKYVAKYDNVNGWTELGGSSNPLAASTTGTINSICSDASGNIYAAGEFNDGTNNYVAKYDVKAGSWSELGGSSNPLAASTTGIIYSICADASGNIYAAGDFKDGNDNNYVAKYDNVNGWTELGGDGNGLSASNNDIINSICSDASGNIYAAGKFQNNSGNQYVAKYDITTNTWTELGINSNNPSNANGDILSICSDASGNIYATGEFDDGGNKFVAEYNNVWTGASSVSGSNGNWNDAANWSCGVPSNSSLNKVFISPVTTGNYYPVIEASSTVTAGNVNVHPEANVTVNGILTADSIYLYSDATGTGTIAQSTGTINCSKATVQRYISQSQHWRLTGFPFTQATTISATDLMSNYATYDASGYNAYTYDETKDNGAYGGSNGVNTGWAQFLSGTVTSDKGILMLGSSSSTVTLSATGTLNTGTVSVPLSYTSSSKGWNLIANPYPSNIDWTHVYGTTNNNPTTTLDNAIYSYEPNSQSYVSYVPGTSTGNQNNVIANGAGFFVHSTRATSLSFNESDKTVSTPANGAIALFGNGTQRGSVSLDGGDNNNTVSSPSVVRLTLKQKGDAYGDQAVVLWGGAKDATDGFDSKYDAYDLGRMKGANLGIEDANGIDYSIFHGTKLKDASVENRTVALKVTQLSEGNYTMNANIESAIVNGNKLYLYDKYLDTYSEVKDSLKYNFMVSSIEASQSSSRFSLVMNAKEETDNRTSTISLLNNPTSSNSFVLYSQGDFNTVQWSLVNESGNSIGAGQLSNVQKGGTYKVNTPVITNGLYFIKLTGDNKKLSTLKLVKQ